MDIGLILIEGPRAWEIFGDSSKTSDYTEWTIDEGTCEGDSAWEAVMQVT